MTPSVSSERSTNRRAASRIDVSAILVSMPFFPIRMPSLQLGLLGAIGRQRGFSVSTLHLNVEFAAHIGPDLYEQIFSFDGVEIGNWLFALDAFGDQAADREGRLVVDHPEAVNHLKRFNIDAAALQHLRREVVPEYLDLAEGMADWSSHAVVGFTSTFQQNTASFALARRLKERFPHLITLFGGANLEGEMGRELLRTCPWIDYVVDGEGDEAFPAFLTALAEGRSPTGIPGLVSRGSGRAVPADRAFTNLETLPVPDYDEFFQRVERLAIYSKSSRHRIRLPFESARGCWWGQKHHCTFCGLNGGTMSFRQKSSQRVLSELGELTRRYGSFRFGAVDNIMPMDFLSQLIPALTEQERHYDIFFMVKANLSRTQIRALSDAGVRSVLPGIESLNSQVLRLMRKGVSASQNVNFLRWATYYGLDTNWNLLWGFPDEQEEHYRSQAALIPHLIHLQPPGSFGRIWIERFSPYFFDRARFPIRRIVPHSSLSYIYPPQIDREKVAYLFEHEFENELPGRVFKPIQAALRTWHERWAQPRRPSLTFRWSPGRLHVEDRRDPTEQRLYSFDSPLAEIYKALTERPLSAALVKARLDLPASDQEVAEALDLFAQKGLVMRDEDLFLALALPAQTAVGEASAT
jgi:ribosomal peptide maturation radical SAM protein 1